MTQAQKVIAITGASGYIGARLLQELEKEQDLGKLIAIDTKPAPLPIHNLAAYRQDVTTSITNALRHHRATTLVHLAFTTRFGQNRQKMKATREANLNSLRKVLESCALAKIKHVIYLSSHSTYGAHRNNPVPLTERATQRPLPDFPFGIDKYLSEQILRTFSKDYPETKVSILRPCIVLGPTANHEAAKSLFLHRLIKVHGSDPPIQFLHEDDLARILAIIAMGEIPGEFNVAGEGVVFYREIAKIVHTKTVTLPAAIAHPLTKISRRLGIQSGTQATALSMTRYPIVLSTGKLRMTTGYRFWYTSQETLTAFANTMCL